MLGSGSMSRSPTSSITTTTAASIVAATATSIQINTSASSAPLPGSVPSPQLDKSEINDAVTKVLKGYDWTLVPTATK